MNFNKFINSDYLKSNPLCGISTYKDELNLATGACTRNIKKYELTGNESFYSAGQNGETTILVYFSPSDIKNVGNVVSYDCFCSHYKIGSYYSPSENEGVQYTTIYLYFRIKQSSTADFKTFLQQQYAAGTPVCVWYVLKTPTTETITIPSGLSGVEEGYLNQSGTPTPTNPIYPTANTVEQWFDINHYIMGTSTDTITTLPADIYANDTTATVGLKGQMEQSGTPTPTTPIQPQECGDLETTGEHAGQYKIPISSANTTTNIYLGEVESTRRIMKLVLTGEEGWTITSNGVLRIGLSGQLRPSIPICTHYLGSNSTAWANIPDKSVTVSISGYLAILDTTYTTTTAFKTYLQQQYAAGTPVCVWYVLAEPTTGIVNEPLRKISDYADEVSNVTIPTIAGANTLSIGTTLQPSEVTVNYKGWHEASEIVHRYQYGEWDGSPAPTYPVYGFKIDKNNDDP